METSDYLLKFYLPILSNPTDSIEDNKSKNTLKSTFLGYNIDIPYTIEPYQTPQIDNKNIEFTKLYYTIRECCDFLKISKQRFDTLVSQGLIKTTKIHKKTVIEKDMMITLYNNFK